MSEFLFAFLHTNPIGTEKSVFPKRKEFAFASKGSDLFHFRVGIVQKECNTVMTDVSSPEGTFIPHKYTSYCIRSFTDTLT